MNFEEYTEKVGRANIWIKKSDVDELARSFDELAMETARAYCEYFHNGDKGARCENNMEVLTAALADKYGAFAQVRKMGAPDASLVIYGSRAAWYNGLQPVASVRFDTLKKADEEVDA